MRKNFSRGPMGGCWQREVFSARAGGRVPHRKPQTKKRLSAQVRYHRDSSAKPPKNYRKISAKYFVNNIIYSIIAIGSAMRKVFPIFTAERQSQPRSQALTLISLRGSVFSVDLHLPLRNSHWWHRHLACALSNRLEACSTIKWISSSAKLAKNYRKISEKSLTPIINIIIISICYAL
jgi:hypothetical protein